MRWVEDGDCEDNGDCGELTGRMVVGLVRAVMFDMLMGGEGEASVSEFVNVTCEEMKNSPVNGM